MATGSSDRNKVLSITMKAVDQMSPTMIALTRMVKQFAIIGVAAFKGITFPVVALGRSLMTLLNPMRMVQAVMGAWAVKVATTWLTGTARFADEMDELATRLGINVEKLQEWAHVASMAGVQVTSLVNGMTLMASALDDAASGSGKAAEAMKRLNLDARQLIALAPDEQFQAIADALGEIGNMTERTALARDLFGKGGGELLRVLNQGGDAIRRLKQEARELGVVLSSADIARGVAFQDSLERVAAVIKGLRNVITIPFFEAAADAVNALTDFAKNHLDDLKIGAQAVAREVEYMVRATIEFAKLWRDLVKDDSSIQAMGAIMKSFGRFLLQGLESTLKAGLGGTGALLNALLVPLATFGFEAGKLIGVKIYQGIGNAMAAIASTFQGNNPIATAWRGAFSGVKKHADEVFADVAGGAEIALGASFKAAADSFTEHFGELRGFASQWSDDMSAHITRFAETFNELAKDNPRIAAFIETLQRIRAEIAGVAEETAKVGTTSKDTEKKVKTFWDGFNTAASEAWSQINDNAARGAAAFTELFGAWNSGISSMIDSAVEGTFKIGDAFKEMGKQVLKVLAAIIAKEIALGIVRMIFGSQTSLISIGTNARGNAFSNGNVLAFAHGGVVDRPTLFPMRNGVGLMGEAGEEAIMPLRRNRRGQLGVMSEGGGGGVVENHYHTVINAVDAKSFNSMMATAEGQRTIESVVQKSMHRNSVTRTAIQKLR